MFTPCLAFANIREVQARCTRQGAFPILIHGSAMPDIVSQSIAIHGCWERDLIGRMEDFLRAPATPSGAGKRLMVDIGANIGVYTASMAHLGHRVIAVEPFNFNVPLLLHTLCHPTNRLMDRVTLYKARLPLSINTLSKHRVLPGGSQDPGLGLAGEWVAFSSPVFIWLSRLSHVPDLIGRAQ